MTQFQYLRKVLTKFSLNNSTKPVGTPLAPHFKISASMCPSSDDDKGYMENISYTNVVGALMYAMVCTRPDLSHTVSMVSRYMHNPNKEHWQAVKRNLRYILGTIDVGIKFQKQEMLILTTL